MGLSFPSSDDLICSGSKARVVTGAISWMRPDDRFKPRSSGRRGRLPRSRIRQRSSLHGCPHVVQASESDLMARGVAIDLVQMAERVGPQYEATEYEDLSGEEGFSLDYVIADD